MSTNKKRRGRIHGHKGHKSIDVRMKLPRSVVHFLTKSTKSSRKVSVTNNTSFIDNYFNSQSRLETFRVSRKKEAWTNPGFLHVKMSKMKFDEKASKAITNSADMMDMCGLHVIGQKTNRYKHTNAWKRKFRLKNGKKHNELVQKCIKESKGALTVFEAIPLHKFWCKYAEKVMEKTAYCNAETSKFNEIVSKMDLHGCLIKIIRCKSRPHYVDREGIIVLVSKNRFIVLTTLPKTDELICVPFKDSAFTFELSNRVVTIYGDKYRQFIT